MQISKEGIKHICEAIFAVDNAHVVEAYSEYDKEPKSFAQIFELADYIQKKLSEPKGYAYVFVIYPEMKGSAKLKKIRLNPINFKNHKFQYTWEGWGMISVQIASPQFGLPSSITANSEARANKWAIIYPESESPCEWNWPAVTKHKNRLKRVLKQYA